MSQLKRLSDEIGNYKISAVKRNPPKNYPLHWHEYFEIEYIASGSGTYTINNIDYNVKPGTLFFITPIDFTSMKFDDEYTVILNISFSADWISTEMQQILQRHMVIDNFESDLLSKLYDEITSEKAYKDSNIKHLLGSILINIARAYPALNSSDSTNEHPDIIFKILSHIHLKFRDNITLQTLSEHVGLSPNYISKLFHNYTGKTYNAYLTDIRLSFASSLLANSNIPTTQVCYGCGFNSFAHFCRTFKKKYDLTPAQYRRNALK